MAAGSVLGMAMTLYDYLEPAIVIISALVQAVLKCKHQQMFRLTTGEDVKEHSVLCQKGQLNILNYVLHENYRRTASIHFTNIANKAPIRMVYNFLLCIEC